MSDLQDIIASSIARAFNAGFASGKEEVLSAIKFVKVDYYDQEVAIISDLEEELAERAKLYQSYSLESAPEQGKVAKHD